MDTSEILESLFNERSELKKGDFFHQSGTVCNRIGILQSGMLKYFYINNEGEEIVRWMALPGDYVISLSSFITETASFENIVAVKPASLLVMSKQQWNEAYQNIPTVQQLWTNELEQLCIGYESRIHNLIAANAQQRYLWLLQHEPRFLKEVPNKYLAKIIGVTPRHLSRLMLAEK